METSRIQSWHADAPTHQRSAGTALRVIFCSETLASLGSGDPARSERDRDGIAGLVTIGFTESFESFAGIEVKVERGLRIVREIDRAHVARRVGGDAVFEGRQSGFESPRAGGRGAALRVFEAAFPSAADGAIEQRLPNSGGGEPARQSGRMDSHSWHRARSDCPKHLTEENYPTGRCAVKRKIPRFAKLAAKVQK